MRKTVAAVLLGSAVLLWGVGTSAGSEVWWTAAHELAPPGLDYRIAAGDLDADGDDDIVDLGYGNLYRNIGCSGPLAWQLEEDALLNIATCSGNSIALGDCDADGDLDIIEGCYECCSLRMVWNIGTPQQPGWQYGGAIAGDPNGGYFAYVCLADIDADGDLDLIGTSSGGAIGIYDNTGTPEVPSWVWLELIPGIGFGASDGVMALGDLDGDGDLDIVGGSGFSRVKCWENVGTSQVYSYVRNDAMLSGVDGPTDGVHGISLPDVDCDGDCDLVVVGWYAAVYLYLSEQITPVVPASWGTIKALYRETPEQVSPN